MTRIRSFAVSDAEQVKHVVGSVLRSYGLSMDPETDKDLEDITSSYADGAFYVIEAEGAVIGCGGLKMDAGGKTAELRKMYILPAFRGRGLGRALLEKLLADATQRGVTTVHLETNVVLKEAIALYARYGFEKTSPVGCHSPRCDVFMTKTLEGSRANA